MTTSRLYDYLNHMAKAANEACLFVQGIKKAEFINDRRTQQAVMMNLMIIGEAATKIMDTYPDFITSHPEILWTNMRGMRNRLIHGYFSINLDVVFETTQTALPDLLNKLMPIIANLADK